MPRGTMKLIDRTTGLMECRVCGTRHRGTIRPDSGGQMRRGSWQCLERARHTGSSARIALATEANCDRGR